MQLLKITTYPTPILKAKAHKVEQIDSRVRKLALAMAETMDANEGVGLAAPQVGIPKQIIIVKDAKKNLCFVNPCIVKKSKKQYRDEEGCLSLPGIFLKVKRAEKLEVIAQTPQGKNVKIIAKGLGARIFQHEIDHLHGKLIVDRVGPLQRLRLRKKLTVMK